MLIGYGIGIPFGRNFGTAGSSTLLPDDVTGLEAWFDATVSGSITIATGVSAWDSQSGVISVVQGTGASQPANGGSINSLNALVFDGSNDSLASSVGTIVNWTTDKLTVFAIVRTPASWSGDKTIFSKSGNPDLGADGAKWRLMVNGSGNPIFEVGTGSIVAVTSSTVLSTSTDYLLTGIYDGVTLSIAVNSDAAQTTAVTGNLISNTTCPLKVGRGKYDGDLWTGSIGELCLYSEAVSGTDLTGVKAGLTAKWLTAGAPSGGNAMGVLGLTYSS